MSSTDSIQVSGVSEIFAKMSYFELIGLHDELRESFTMYRGRSAAERCRPRSLRLASELDFIDLGESPSGLGEARLCHFFEHLSECLLVFLLLGFLASHCAIEWHVP